MNCTYFAPKKTALRLVVLGVGIALFLACTNAIPKISGTFGSNGNTNHPLVGDGSEGDVVIITPQATNSSLPNGRTMSAQLRINSVAANGQDLTMSAVWPTPDFAVGDEVMWIIMAQGFMSDCDTTGTLVQGNYGFAHIKSMNIGTQAMTIDNPISITLNSTATGLSSAVTSAGSHFCTMQLVRIPNFNSLTFGGGSTDIHLPGPFSYSSGGGVIAFRVKGYISLPATGITINAVGMGFGSAGGSSQGNSSLGSGNAITLANDTGGGGGNSGGGGGNGGTGGGGGGGGAGGAKEFNCAGAACNSNFMLLGGGGGGGNLTFGGRGGGIVMAAVNNLTGSFPLTIDVSGDTFGQGTSGGGGGGGSVQFIVFNQNIPSATIKANGSSGANGGTFGGGGGGGGGVIYNVLCNFMSTTNNYFLNGGIGGTGPSNGVTGAPGALMTAGAGTSNLCN